MKNLFYILTIVSLSITNITFASNHDNGKDKGKKKDKNKIESVNKNVNYDSSYPPKVKTAPFLKGVAGTKSLELIKSGGSYMLVDRNSDDILYESLKEGKDYVRVYTDQADNNKVCVIWSADKVDKKTKEIQWKLYSYKEYPDLGWRPVDNMLTSVKSYK